MEFRHLRYFVAVAEELHFSRASAKLHVAQPSLSQQIRDLEEELGVLLLERNNRSVRLTPAGAIFLEDARKLIAAAKQAGAHAGRAHRGEVGKLNLSYVISATCHILTSALREFRVSHPDVRLALQDLNETQQWPQLLEGSIDVAFTRTPLRHEAIAIRAVERQLLCVLLPTTHPLAGLERISLDKLAGATWVVVRPTEFPTYHAFISEQCRRAGFELTNYQPVRDLASVIWMVSAGIGVGFGCTGIEDLHRDGMVCRPVSPQVETCVWMQWRKDDKSPVLRRFLEVVNKVYKLSPERRER